MSIMLLPQEVLYHIFQYLPISDRKAVALTCRSMYESCVNGYGCCMCSRRSLEGGRKRRLITVTMTADEVANGFETLQCSQQLGIRRIRFESASLQRDQQSRSGWDAFWENLGPDIWELSFHSCDISERTFCEILLEQCPNLESLTLDDCNSLFMSGKLLDATAIDRQPGMGRLQMASISSTLKNILELNLNNNRYLSDAIFNRLTLFTTNVTRLSLAGCQISFHPAIHKRFYPPSQTNAPASESVLTFQNVFIFLERQSAKIVSLDFSNTPMDDGALKKLFGLEDLHLEELFLSNCQQVSVVGIEAICAHQPGLRILDLSKCFRLLDRAMIAISRCLARLTHLNVRGCGRFTADGIVELGKFRNDLDRENSVIKHLVKLNLSSCDLTEDTVIALSRSMMSSSLRHLNLSDCGDGVTDASMRFICANLRSLRSLKLASCKAITDAVLVGNVDDGTGSSTTSPRLSDIRGLRKLDLAACSKITDAGFQMIRFRELVWLNVSLCDKLSDVGLVSIGAHCNGSVEKLLLSQCRDITDIGVVALVKCLPRLKYLDLRGCRNIKQPTLDALKHWCSELHYLDITMCPYVTLQSAEALESMVSRLHVEKKNYFLLPNLFTNA